MAELTAEQLARIDANRKQAKERLRAAEAISESAVAGVDKGLATQGAANSHRNETGGRLRASKMTRGYYEYNLSTMRDTKAGFIEEEKAESPEKKRRVLDLDTIALELSAQDSCVECGSIDLDVTYAKVFRTQVCKACIEKIPDKYSLLTKTEAKEDYLLTDGELRDRDLFPVWEKANPHKSTWNNMLLYLRRDLEQFAVKKWGGLDGLDREFDRRDDEKRTRKEKKYRRSVADLRRRTRADEWEKQRRERLRLENEHEHEFEATGDGDEQKCSSCGLIIEVEEF
ncbi:DNA repair protein rad14 [Coemansia sp. RSA 1822]|nr:DNA repair protein rad14 [Coemansia sp. RSA 638]KAJ2122508.1 DNA repair protein rad14 [Coemansia sp. RSA 720]KAJ2538295.1 DNA repair protein rad14 [Coemansia sp. RSA 1853]KAJ2565099.1 DNA repair protein rad14 [Coemansia sp. RSA 1822]